MVNNIIINKDLISRKLDDELIILNLSNSCYYGLKKSGIEIFEFIQERKKCSFNEIIEYMTASFNADSRLISKDAEELIYDLEKEQIIKLV